MIRFVQIGSGYYTIRKDLVEADLLIPSINTNEYYGQEQLSELKYIGNVNEDFEDDFSGGYVKFRDPRGHFVFLYSIDLEWVEEALSES